MNKVIFISIFYLLLTCSCDCYQRANGIIFDKNTNKPIDSVSVGKYEVEDKNNPYTRKEFSDTNGNFYFHRTSGGLGRCQILTLYFMKNGYKTIKKSFDFETKSDTIYLEKISAN